MTMTPIHSIVRFLRSMAGHIFVLLTVGMSAAAILSLYIAEQARKHDFERIRTQRVIASAADIAQRLKQNPERIGAMLAAQQIMGAALAPDGIALTKPDSILKTALEERFGPHAEPEAGQVPTGFCFPAIKVDFKERAAGLIGAPRPDCWIVRFTDQTGERRSMAIYLPRLAIAPTSTLNPLYLLLIVASSAGLSIIVARFVSKPLRRLEKAAEAFSVSLDPEPISERGPEEVRAALSTFNMMQQRVREGFLERTQLLAGIGHDLQTPLTRLRLRLEQVEDPALKERLILDLSAMQTLVREGLDLASSADSGEDWSLIDIDSLLASIAEDAQEFDSPVTFLSGCGGTVRVKPNALRRCIGNLVDNAVTYGGSAEIACARDVGKLVITVRDRGKGIDEALLDKMFEPYTRGEAGQAGGRAGTGIGLTIARTLALTFGGSVRLRNAPDGGVIASISIKE